MNNLSAVESQDRAKKSGVPAGVWIALWTLFVICIAYFGRDVARRILPKAEEIYWTTHIPISSDVAVSIRAWRHGNGDFSAKRPLNDCTIALHDAHVLESGPNTSIFHYVNQAGQTIRGAAPPDAVYLADWLKDAGQPATSATPIGATIAAKVAPLFDPEKLDAGLGPEWSVTKTETVPELSYVGAIIALVLVWFFGLGVIVFSASSRRERLG